MRRLCLEPQSQADYCRQYGALRFASLRLCSALTLWIFFCRRGRTRRNWVPRSMTSRRHLLAFLSGAIFGPMTCGTAPGENITRSIHSPSKHIHAFLENNRSSFEDICTAYDTSRNDLDNAKLDSVIPLPANFFRHATWHEKLAELVQQDFQDGRVRLLNGWLTADHEISFSLTIRDGIILDDI